MIALFQGVPQMVMLEEPHHGVQFGVHLDGMTNMVYVHDATGNQIESPSPSSAYEVPLPVRASNSRVVHITELRRQLNVFRSTAPTAIPVTGSASFAIAVLDPPWRQRFEGTVDHAGTQVTSGGFVANRNIAQRVTDSALLDEVRLLVTTHGS
jgi:hypothetical protein